MIPKNQSLLLVKRKDHKSIGMRTVIFLSLLLSLISTVIFWQRGQLLAYGDAESHLNIAKRVVGGLTPGLAQLGGVWLPLPHILLVPFVFFDKLWRTGLAGSIVSGTSFLIVCIYIYKFVYLLTRKTIPGILAVLVFALNPNVLYMQSTGMTELPLIAFFILSSYYFYLFLSNDKDLYSLILASLFGFTASLTRYDGWFLVIFEAAILFGHYLIISLRERTYEAWKRVEGIVLLFCTLAFFGILLWLLWNKLILGDPFYFTNSPFSAKSQQQGWLARGELPSYHDLKSAFLYYSVTSIENSGLILTIVATLGLVMFLFDRKQKNRIAFLALAFVPFVFYVTTLYLGQSVIFIPALTPKTFEWQLFNVRYGMMMIPTIALLTGYLSNRFWSKIGTVLVVVCLLTQTGLFLTGRAEAISIKDGISGLSTSKRSDVDGWIAKNYDGGLVLLDDFARVFSITRSSIPMKNVIYVGNRPYWEESLKEPEKYARWIILQEDDTLWKTLYEDEGQQKRLYKYFAKAYTSPKILVFKRNHVSSLVTQK